MEQENDTLKNRKVAIQRLSIGLLQGLLLYLLFDAAQFETWPALTPALFIPTLLAAFIVPIVLIASWRSLPPKALMLWAGVALLVISALGYYDHWRNIGAPLASFRTEESGVLFPSATLCVFLYLGFFIAQTLVCTNAGEKRWVASYQGYFDYSWKLIIQTHSAGAFVLATWLVLWLGAWLFKIIHIEFLFDLLSKREFFIPVIAVAYASALHLTDVRASIVKGIRNLWLSMLSWLLPLAVLLLGGFLFTLPFAGLNHLWSTKHATPLLLTSIATLILLINASFQNGKIENEVPRLLRMCARIGCLLLLPMALIGVYALGLRVQEYGWTVDRIIGASCLLVACTYATGYAWAATQKADWLAKIIPVNIAMAWGILALLLALFSPLLDPARISVNDQLARLEQGKVSAQNFDFDYLRFEGHRYGQQALENLRLNTQGPDAALIQQAASSALKRENRYRDRSSTEKINPTQLRANLQTWPRNQALPDSFLTQNWREVKEFWRLPQCLKESDKSCDAYLMDLDGNGKNEVLLTEPWKALLFEQDEQGQWQFIATLPNSFANCALFKEQLRAGNYRLIPNPYKNIEIAGQRIEVQIDPNNKLQCPPSP